MLFSLLPYRFTRSEELFFSKAEPLILMGRGHSGTRIFSVFCDQLGYNLDAANKMHTGDAADIRFTNRIKKTALLYLKSGVNSRTIRMLKRASLTYYQNLSGDKKLWGWKFPETYLIGPVINQVFPKAKYLHIIRDGRDIAFKTHQTDREEKKLGKKILDEMNMLDEPHHKQAAVSWKYQVDAFDDWKQTLRSEQLHEVRFEDFVTSPDIEGKKICDFLSIPFTASEREFLEENINVNKIAQYEEEDDKKVATVERLTAETLRRWDYL